MLVEPGNDTQPPQVRRHSDPSTSSPNVLQRQYAPGAAGVGSSEEGACKGRWCGFTEAG